MDRAQLTSGVKMPPAKKAVRRNNLPQQQREVNPNFNDDDDDEEQTDDTSQTDADGSDDGNPDPAQGEGDNEPQEASQAVEEALPRMLGKPRNGKTFRVGEEIVFKGKKVGGMIISDENIYRGVLAPNSTRFRYHLVVGKGGSVPAANATEISEGEYKATTQL
jgi:hypothetical protein